MTHTREYVHAEARRILDEARQAIQHNIELAAIALAEANAPHLARIREAEAMWEAAKRRGLDGGL